MAMNKKQELILNYLIITEQYEITTTKYLNTEIYQKIINLQKQLTNYLKFLDNVLVNIEIKNVLGKVEYGIKLPLYDKEFPSKVVTIQIEGDYSQFVVYLHTEPHGKLKEVEIVKIKITKL